MKHGKQAFTLIELLVVICIIAILAAMLLPALQSARDSASSATCVNNLMQFSKAVQMYATTYDDFLPMKTAPFYKGGGSGCKWEDALMDVMGQGGNTSFRQAFFCEADSSLDDSSSTGDKKSYSLNNLPDAVHPYLPHYLDTTANLKKLNGKIKGFISGNRTTSIRTASDLIIIGENCAKNNKIGSASFPTKFEQDYFDDATGSASPIHEGVATKLRRSSHMTAGNLFLDGHASHVKPEKTLPSDNKKLQKVATATSYTDNNKWASEAWGSWSDCQERKKGVACKGTCRD